MRPSERRLEAGDGLGEVASVQIPKPLNQLHQARRQRENQRKLTQVVRRQTRCRGRIYLGKEKKIEKNELILNHL